MARTFNGTTDVIQTTIGGLSGFAFGTFAAVVKRNSTAWNAVCILHSAGPTARSGMEIADNTTGNQVTYQFSSGGTFGSSTFTVTNADGWVLIGCSKATGTVAPRFHKYVYSSDTWTHDNGAGTTSANNTVPGGTGLVRLGEWQTSDFFGGDIAVVGCWQRALSDVEFQELAFSLQGWYSTAPDALWVLDQAATTTNLLDLTGGHADQSSITGTTVSANSVPIIGYGHDPILLSSSAASGVTAPARVSQAQGRHRIVVPPRRARAAAPALPPGGMSAPVVRPRPKLARQARAHLSTPVPSQVVVAAPAKAPGFIRIPRRLLASRRHQAIVSPEQSAPPRTGQARVKPPRIRGRTTPLPPPEPPRIWQALRARLRFPKPARPHLAQPVPAQAAVAPPAYPPQGWRARVKLVRAARGRQTGPTPPQVTPTPPVYVPQALRERVRGWRLARGHGAVPSPAQLAPLARVRRPEPRPAPTRQIRIVAAPPMQDRPPLITRIKVRLARIFRGEARQVVPAQIVLPAPPYRPAPARGKKAIWALRRRRAGLEGWMAGSAESCVTPRPSSGTTVYLTATTPRPDSGTTARPGSGITTRPDTGITDNPC